MKRDRQTVNARHAEMLAMIRERQEVLVEDLSEIFEISPMTVRRDLQVLEDQGKVSRFHGGATVDVRAIAPDEKEQVALCQRLIARCAATQVNSGDTLLINGSNTALALLDHLEGKTASAFTNNAMMVGHRFPEGVDVQLSGGVLRGTRHILTGDLALRGGFRDPHLSGRAGQRDSSGSAYRTQQQEEAGSDLPRIRQTDLRDA